VPFIVSLIKFVREGAFSGEDKEDGQEWVETKDVMSEFPRYLLSIPNLKPFSARLRTDILSRKKEQEENVEEETKLQKSASYKAEAFHQARSIGEFLSIAFKRDKLEVLDFYEEGELSKVDKYGAKFLLAGTDVTVFNFLQDYVPALLGLDTVKNMHLKKGIEIYLVPSEQNTLCSYLAARDPLYRQNVFQYFSNMNPIFKHQVKPGGYIQEATTAEDFDM